MKLSALIGLSGALALLPAIGSAGAQEYKEAPALAALVADGTLPPVVERLPASPEVVTPLQEVGQYGGTLRFGLRGSSDHNHILRLVSAQGLVRWNPQFTEVVPNLAERWEVDPEGKVFTFYLREGLKWSDGQPFTADDVLFNVNDLIKNTEFAPTNSRWIVNGDPVQVDKVDDRTVRFTFAGPYGDFLNELATPQGQYPVFNAKHYCSQFLPSYNDDIDALVADSGAGDWQTLYLQKCGDIEVPTRWSNPDRPTMDPWVISSPYTGGATQVVLERNPYFWQVDTEGNQLPYIDRLSAEVSQDVESLLLSVIGGNIDFALRHIDPPANRPVLFENQEKGGYRMFAADPGGGSQMSINLNLTHPDPELRELFNTKDFRVALSLGMDRREVIDTALLGVGEPWQVGDFEGYPYYHEQLSTQFLEYDPDQANTLLDGIGLTRGADGTRVLPSGKPVRFIIDVVPTYMPDHVDQLEIIEQQWARIGVDVDINPIERTFFSERVAANQHDAAVWDELGNKLVGFPDVVPLQNNVIWAVTWGQWYQTGGAQGEEPPESIKERFRLWEAARSTVDMDEKVELRGQINQLAADAYEKIGVTKAAVTYGIAKTNLMNVPETMPSGFYYPTPGPTLLQTWFYK
ncbi:peptide ABC transporter substrate-binding protein [Devosia yakushimensis]|uniref:Peptide ABC transporter substrate-binding protein n=1 Tax=Devosia yakushimensis TaxID=470028 RepID=A0ABQ5UJ66_9HYPH|nr:ABC transporter substrate-binding protein [Devosia yakushimensis]GLQ12135.1 peptide ABC transporter substrate-binding protein [Devosia yakushimensis]